MVWPCTCFFIREVPWVQRLRSLSPVSCFIHGWTSSPTYATRWSAWARARYSLSIFSIHPYNPAGDLTQKKTPSGTSSYSYDSQGNLRQVTLEDGRRIDYAIDPDNRRTGKRTNGQLQWQLVWQDQLRPIARLKADHTLEATYYYADKPNVPEAMQKNGKTYRIVSDPLGSVRLVIDSETGDVAQQLDYDAWGQVTLDTNPGFQPFGYAGGLYDPDTGLTRFGARDYDGETGRWTAKDPILFEGGDSNLYGYVGGNPLSRIDPLGLDDFPVIYNGGAGTLWVVPPGSSSAEGFPAGNNTTSSSRGPWAPGTYAYGYPTTHKDDAPNSAYGSNGNAVFNVPGCKGCGVHSGRQGVIDKRGGSGVQHVTEGCIRTTDDATKLIQDLIRQGHRPVLEVTR